MKSKVLISKVKSSAALLSLILGLSGAAFSQETAAANTTNNSNDVVISLKDLPKVGGTLQVLGQFEYLKADDVSTDTNGNHRDDTRIYLFQKQARLNVSGGDDFAKYNMSVWFGGEEVPNGSNSVYSLRDAWIDLSLVKDILGVRVGQFKVPYSRAQLRNSDYDSFADESINVKGFNIQYDTGLAVWGKMGPLTGAVGTFQGAGVDVPQRYIPVKLNMPMTVARIGYTTMDEDIFTVKQFDPKGKDGVAFFLNGLYEKDSLVGHSSVMKSRKTDLSLLQNPAWNPYIADAKYQSMSTDDNFATLQQYGADVAFQTKAAGLTFNGGVELNYGQFKSDLGKIILKGGEAFIGVYTSPVQVSLRYAILMPDKNNNFGYYKAGTAAGYSINQSTGAIVPFSAVAATTTSFLGDEPIHEINPSINVFLSENVKLIMDLQIWIDTPVVSEKSIGAYNLMTQMGQASYTASATNTIERQNALSGRMSLQYTF